MHNHRKFLTEKVCLLLLFYGDLRPIMFEGKKKFQVEWMMKVNGEFGCGLIMDGGVNGDWVYQSDGCEWRDCKWQWRALLAYIIILI